MRSLVGAVTIMAAARPIADAGHGARPHPRDAARCPTCEIHQSEWFFCFAELWSA